MPKNVCRFCKAQLATWRDLRIHCHVEHSTEYKQVEQWLGRTVLPRLESFEKLAKEGLEGHKAT